MKNSSDTIRNRTRHLPACSAVLQTIAPPRAGTQIQKQELNQQEARLPVDTAAPLPRHTEEVFTARSICTGSHVTRPPVPSRYIIGVGQGRITRLGYDSPQFENPCNTDRHIKMEMPILAGDPVSTRIIRHVDATETKWVHKNSTTLTADTMTAMNIIGDVRMT